METLGVGHQFDVVEIEAAKARAELLLHRKAVYASPFDLQYYGRMKKVGGVGLLKSLSNTYP